MTPAATPDRHNVSGSAGQQKAACSSSSTVYHNRQPDCVPVQQQTTPTHHSTAAAPAAAAAPSWQRLARGQALCQRLPQLCQCSSSAVWLLPLLLALLLAPFPVASSDPSSPPTNNPTSTLSHNEGVDHEFLHPYSKEAVMHGAKLPYRKSREECYRRTQPRNSSTVVTFLLPPTPAEGASVITSGGLANLLANTPADVVLFHTSWSQQDIDALKAKAPNIHMEVLCVANIDWETGHRVHNWEFVDTRFQGPGYRSMCRWFSRRMFNAMHAMGYTWIIRLDDDSELPAVIPYNIIETMEQHNATYGFRAFDIEQAPLVLSLPEALKFWLVSQKMDVDKTWLLDFFKNKSLDGISSAGFDNRMIYNNFFVSKVSMWMQPQVQGWLKYLEMLKGYHKFRWGDAVVHLFTTGLFLQRQEMLTFDFEYKHWIHEYHAGSYSQWETNLPKLDFAKGANAG